MARGQARGPCAEPADNATTRRVNSSRAIMPFQCMFVLWCDFLLTQPMDIIAFARSDSVNT
eukprot:scaffold278_cov42-Prasinocladus_malaysianus.AAC.1